jgi:hypothetical protein
VGEICGGTEHVKGKLPVFMAPPGFQASALMVDPKIMRQVFGHRSQKAVMGSTLINAKPHEFRLLQPKCLLTAMIA